LKFSWWWLVALWLVGCAATEKQLRIRAAFDLDCSESELEVVEIDARTRGVRGCGQHVTYVESCAPNCTWVLNTDTRTRESNE
jgi:hypothetical protein